MSIQKGSLHLFSPGTPLTAFQYEHPTNTNSTPNAIVFIGGLGDNYQSISYVSKLNSRLSNSFTLFQIQLTSSSIGWGTGSLNRDIGEIESLVKYLKNSLHYNKVVLFGHSTGTQDSIHYHLNHLDNEVIDGLILQASASDREALPIVLKQNNHPNTLEELNQEAQLIFDQQGGDALLPKVFSDAFFGAPINAYRWLSLALKNGDDDYFSSDLSDDFLQKTFGEINKPLLVLYSGEDEFVPKTFDKQNLLYKWANFTKPGVWSRHSKVIPNANHRVDNDEEATNTLINSINSFLTDL